jgi:hypothetical protein
MRKLSKAHSIAGVSEGRPEHDFYPTPLIATYSLLDREVFEGTVWECACGDGAISKILEKEHDVISTDLIYRGYGDGGIDFLKTDRKASNIITNPPYKYATEFAEHALKSTDKKVALLLKVQFLEGIKRYDFFKNSPLKKVYVFSRRIHFSRNGEKLSNHSMMCFSWFVWEHGYEGEPIIDWIMHER